ncbi:putative xanthine dehydrogenase subunit A [mine drainage metagenome]|uniref:Putative xanthine dehydrogenase subunit A n=1 Tax=mine drainage metagenome TaxID=410659 RepID=A0A1J5QX21_9ZZZZ
MNNTEWISAAARLQAQQQPFALVSVLRVHPPASARPGDKALVTADGAIYGWIGGGCAQPAVIKTVRQALLDGQPRTIRIAPSDHSEVRTLGDVLEFGMACHSGGTLEIFIDPVLPAVHLALFGDSPVARALAALAPRVGFSVTVVADGATALDFPDAERVLVSDDVAHVCEALSPVAFAIVATQGRRDLHGLKAALALRPHKLWFVASARKAGVLKQSLVASGEDAADVAAIVAPAGEPIGAQTAEEIALSVLAAVVAARRMPASAATDARITRAADATVVDDKQVSVFAAKSTEPEVAKSCCGGEAKKAAAAVLSTAGAEAPAALSEAGPNVAEAPKKSCCGG